MLPEQASAIIAIADRIRFQSTLPLDREAAQLIQHLFTQKPDALYQLVQLCLQNEHALQQAQQANDALLSQLQLLDEAKQTRSWFRWSDKSLPQPHQHFVTKAKNND